MMGNIKKREQGWYDASYRKQMIRTAERERQYGARFIDNNDGGDIQREIKTDVAGVMENRDK